MMLAIGALTLGLMLTPQQLHQVDAAMVQAMARLHIAGMSIGIAQDGRMAYARGYGRADVATGRAAGPKTTYAIGSLTKQFTAACVLALVADRKLSLDDPLQRYVPSLPKAAAVTVRQLLNQTSGIPDYADDPDFHIWGRHPVSHARVLAHVRELELHFAPGTTFEYSNSNYFLLGMIVERVSGTSYAQYVLRRILHPLHLASSGYAKSGRAAGRDRAWGYAWSGTGFVPAGVASFDAAFSAGGLVSNVYDLTAWNAALLNDRVLPHALTQLMFSPGVVTGGYAQPYGMGLALSHMYGRPVAMHTGAIAGFSAFTGTALPARLEVTVLTNADGIDTTPIAKTVFAIADPPASSAVANGFTPAQNERPAITALLQSMLAALGKGELDRSLLSDAFRSSVSADWIAGQSAALQRAGAPQSYDFAGSTSVDGAVAYRYNVTFTAGTRLVIITIAPSGKVDALSVLPFR